VREARDGAGSASTNLLGAVDPEPVGAANFGAGSGMLLVCDHAGRAVPQRLGRLGLSETVFDTHIAWDIGALGFAERLTERVRSTLIWQRYSRLVIDCNRAPDHPGAIPAVSDRVPIPRNEDLSEAERAARVASIHAPYHARIAAEIDARIASGELPLIICAHSFTPVMQDDVRPWHVGVLHGGASPASEALLRLLRAEGDLVVGDNQPYAMDGTDYTAPTHAWARGLDVIELEIRQDLLADIEGQTRFADLFARLLPQLLEGPGAIQVAARLD
jgi:predicted N-formylglutamate amidohydrolase